MTTILLADKSEVSRRVARLHLETQPGWHVVAEAWNGEQAIDQAIEAKPDVVVLAYDPYTSIGVIKRLRARVPKTEVLVYTAYEINLESLIEAGARGCVLKSEALPFPSTAATRSRCSAFIV